MRIVVSGGLVKSATLLCPPPLTEEKCRSSEKDFAAIYAPEGLISQAKSISQLFDFIASTSQGDPNARIQMTLDPTYGFPASFYLDNPDSSDDEIGFRISDFKLLNDT